MSLRAASLFVFATALLPEDASAVTLVQVVGFFHLFVGLFVVAIFFTFVVGAWGYFARLGTWPTYRDTSIEILEWAITMLFVLLVILGLVQFFQSHSSTALLILAVVLVVAIAFFVFRVALGGGEKKKKDTARPGAAPRPH